MKKPPNSRKTRKGSSLRRMVQSDSQYCRDRSADASSLTHEQRIENYCKQTGHPKSLFVSEDGRMVGTWIMGNDYRVQSNYYGGYPAGYLKRIKALFPEKRNVLHLFSGKVDLAILPGKTVDLNPATSPDYVDDAQTLTDVPVQDFDLVCADPPYSVEDCEHYQTTMVKRNVVLRTLGLRLRGGAHVVWLDQVLPMYRKDQFDLVAVIGMVKSTNHRFRVCSIFRRREAECGSQGGGSWPATLQASEPARNGAAQEDNRTEISDCGELTGTFKTQRSKRKNMDTEQTDKHGHETARRSSTQFAASSRVDEGAPALSSTLNDWSLRVGRAVACLREWQALEYTGHFIDLHPEQKERVANVARITDAVLREWKLSIKPEPYGPRQPSCAGSANDAPSGSQPEDFDLQRVARPLVERLARRVWGILNHDNDYEGREEWNVASRKALTEGIEEELRAHTEKRPSDTEMSHLSGYKKP